MRNKLELSLKICSVNMVLYGQRSCEWTIPTANPWKSPFSKAQC